MGQNLHTSSPAHLRSFASIGQLGTSASPILELIMSSLNRRLLFSQLTFIVFVCIAVDVLMAHPPEKHADHEHTTPHQMQLPDLVGAKPWSDKPVLNDPERFQFAVVTDRTGGHRPGVWMHGVRNLNLLRPEFVVSVGDLIEGYTEDVAQVEKEWTEFLGFINQLQMRFFFVAGNHDLTNPMMHDIWRKHFGTEWYSFDYKNVHFLCLSTEDPTSRIGDEQLAWIKKDLAESQGARWTFVLLHKPLWTYAERELSAGNQDSTQWKQVEALLSSRPHTVFAGHVHHYVQYKRGGNEYYSLATTGGGSRLRGNDYGEFDHIVWVTMEPDGPRIANIRLDGVLPSDIVTEKSIQRFRNFLSDARIVIEPVLVESGESLQSAELKISITNEFDNAIFVDAQLVGVPLKGLSVDPEQLTTRVPPNDTKQLTCRFALERPLDFENFRNMMLTANIKTDEESPLSAEVSVPIMIDRRHFCPQLTVDLDGSSEEWQGEVEQFSESPTTFGAAQQWQGLGDGSIRFRVAHDENFLYLSGSVADDVIVAGRDRLRFNLDGRLMKDRVASSRLNEHCYVIEVHPDLSNGGKPSTATVRLRREPYENHKEIPVAIQPEPNGYRFEVAIPIEVLVSAQGKDWESFQLNAIIQDIDAAEDQNVYVLWRPAADLQERNSNYAYFFRVAP